MKEDEVYQHLTKMTEEMYKSILKVQSSDYQDQLVAYHKYIEKEIRNIVNIYNVGCDGDLIKEIRDNAQAKLTKFHNMERSIDSKYKIYIRGAGNSGKSTILNALLSLKEDEGSKMGKLPLTFTIDSFSDELEKNEARIIKTDGSELPQRKEDGSKAPPLTREEAIQIEQKERTDFENSRKLCDEIIKNEIKSTSLEEIQEDIRSDIYKQYLKQTTIREIKWGIGKNDFFHNCMLIDTPGLNQELRFTNTLEDIESYEVDGFLWVITIPNLKNKTVIEAYENELKEMATMYKNKKSITIVNMMYNRRGDVFKYGSDDWAKSEKKAKELCYKNFNSSDVVCVNAKLAYDGYINQSTEDIRSSNISELRKKINEMFVERSKKELHESKLEEIDSSFDAFLRKTKQQNCTIKERLDEYDKKYDKINTTEVNKKEFVKERIEKVIKNHLSDVKTRTYENSTRIKNLYKESDVQRDIFIKEELIKVDELQKKLNFALDECLERIHYEFKKLETECIISECKFDKFKIANFLNRRSINKPTAVSKEFEYSNSIISSFTGFFFGRNSGASNLVNGVLNLFKDPVKKLYDEVEKYLYTWSKEFNLDNVISGYASQCRSTLWESMSQTCGNYKTVNNIYKKINTEIKYATNHSKKYNLNEKGLKELLYENN